MNIAERAYQDGQDYRRANSTLLEGEALETQVMQAFTHAGLDFQHWQLYRNNWMSGYQVIVEATQRPTENEG